MKIIVQRFVNVWVEDIYEVDEINQDTIDKAVNYEIDSEQSDVLWETQEDVGPVEVYDENWNLLEKTDEK